MNAFQQLADSLDLAAAVRRGSQRNDLLPPRHEDNVLGEVGNRFSEALRTRLRQGRYDPTPAEIVLVPKPGHTTRPAALLTLADRIVFDALVETLRQRIETALLGKEMVYWPRGITESKRWSEFEQSPLESNATHIAIADVTGFYESISHERLEDVLVSITGRAGNVEALIQFLQRVMSSSKGIPQGLEASDPIASAFLSPVDAAMARGGFHYARHGDDVRIAAKSLSEAREALHVFEQELRRIGLLVNSSKAIIMRVAAYTASITRSDRSHEQTAQELTAARIVEIQDDSDLLEELLQQLGREDLAWNLFYHGNVSLEDVVGEIEGDLRPDDMTIAMQVLGDALQRSDQPDGLSRGEVHFRVSTSLIRLTAGRSPLAIDVAGALLARFPEKAELLSSYLAAQSKKHSRAVLRAVTRMLKEDRFQSDWEQAWLLVAMRKFADKLLANEVSIVRAIAHDEGRGLFVRAEALKTLAKRGEISRALVRRLWSIGSTCFHPDIVAAVHYGRGSNEWCDGFLAGVRDDAINRVVIKQLEAAEGV
ncbi:RNA-directed DNA polymerase [Variovorax sp. LARHSF232]